MTGGLDLGQDQRACGGPFDPFGALYLHVPFCVQRCLYCDFETRACPSDDVAVERYVDEMVRAIRRASKADALGQIRTVYLGGGTPTHLGNRNLATILYTLSLSMHLTPEVECTVECNPESLTEAMVKDLYALGATRLSIGVQTFDDALLSALGRIHDAEAARAAIRTAQARFDNVSVDLMCGLPGQTLEGFEADLHQAVALGVKHVSVYPLTVEERTPLAQLVKEGVASGPDDDLQACMMERAAAVLERAGMRRYEVANYAYPGYESRHNQAYWSGVSYLGLGPGAVTMVQSQSLRARLRCAPDDCATDPRMPDGHVLDDRMPGLGTHASMGLLLDAPPAALPNRVVEVLDLRQRAAEDLMLGMRRSAGVTDAQVDKAQALLPGVADVFEQLQKKGLVCHGQGRFVPTDAGWLRGNALYGALYDLAPGSLAPEQARACFPGLAMGEE